MSKTVKIIFWVLVVLIFLPVILITLGLFFGKVNNKIKTGFTSLFGKKTADTPEPQPAVNSNMYIMLADFTCYLNDSANSKKEFKKGDIFQGKTAQADASYGSDKTLNLVTSAVMIDVIKDVNSNYGVPATACRLMTESELTEYNSKSTNTNSAI